MALVDSTLNVSNHHQTRHGQLPGDEIMPIQDIPFRKVKILLKTAFWGPTRYY